MLDIENQENSQENMSEAMKGIVETFTVFELKYSLDSFDDVKVLKTRCRSKGGVNFFMRFFVFENDLVIFNAGGFVNGVSDEKRGDVLELINDCNRKYKLFKFLLDDDGDLRLEYQIPKAVSEYGLVTLELIARINNIIDECYQKFMKTIWS